MGDDFLGSDAPNKPAKLMTTYPILPQHLNGPQNLTSGHDMFLPPLGNSDPLFGLPGPSNFGSGEPNSGVLFGLPGPSNFVPGEPNSSVLFSHPGPSNSIPGELNASETNWSMLYSDMHKHGMHSSFDNMPE